jgi:hypothetical protein
MSLTPSPFEPQDLPFIGTLTEADIREFRRIYEHEIQEQISDEDARAMAQRLVGLYALLLGL